MRQQIAAASDPDISFSQQVGDKGRAEVVGREVYSRTPLEGAADQATPPGGVFIVRKGVTLTVLRGEGMEIHHGTCVIFTKKHQFNFSVSSLMLSS